MGRAAGDGAAGGRQDTGSRGERVRWARQRRGLTLDVTAGLAGRTEGWLSLVENGLRPLDRFSDIVNLARILRVPMPVITGVRCPGCPLRSAAGGEGR